MDVKEIIKKLFKGSGGTAVYRDERGFPVRRATPDELELEQYHEEERRHKIKELLARKRRERFTRSWKQGGWAIKTPKPRAASKLKKINWG